MNESGNITYIQYTSMVSAQKLFLLIEIYIQKDLLTTSVNIQLTQWLCVLAVSKSFQLENASLS